MRCDDGLDGESIPRAGEPYRSLMDVLRPYHRGCCGAARDTVELRLGHVAASGRPVLSLCDIAQSLMLTDQVQPLPKQQIIDTSGC